MKDVFPDVAKRDIQPSAQGGRQAISLAVTFGFALLGGLIVGRCHILLRYSEYSQHRFAAQKMTLFLG